MWTVLAILGVVYLAGVGWTFVRSGGAKADWFWLPGVLLVLFYLVWPRRD